MNKYPQYHTNPDDIIRLAIHRGELVHHAAVDAKISAIGRFGDFALEKLKVKCVEFMMKCPVTGATTNS